MTDFNDGKWHGWNGGECPVHPMSEVELRFSDPYHHWLDRGREAGFFSWSHRTDDQPNGGNIVAFRVVKEHREPREIWVRTGVESDYCYSPHVARNEPFEGATLFREVLQ